MRVGCDQSAFGQDDILTQGYCLSGDATVDAVVKNASNVVVRSLFTGASQLGQACFFNGNNTAVWDGTDAGGRVVADGPYTIAVHAVAPGGGSAADLAIPTTVDNATPGRLTQPSFGQTRPAPRPRRSASPRTGRRPPRASRARTEMPSSP